MSEVTCANCGGSGMVVRDGQAMTCGSCNGRGVVNR